MDYVMFVLKKNQRLSLADLLFILTVPHGACIVESTERTCDRNAVRAANSITQMLLKSGVQRDHIVSFLHTDPKLPRSELDMNRPEARLFAYRQRIRNYLDTTEVLKRDRNTIVFLGVHSYPKNTYYANVIKADLVFLDNQGGRFPWQSFVQQKLSMEPRVQWVEGSLVNDIIQMARIRQRIYKSILLEYSESLSVEELNELNSIVIPQLIDYCL